MFDKSQLMKGILEGCILKIISRKVTYGYEIMESLRVFGFTDIREGTIYPLLVRLEKKQFISAEFRPSPLGPRRKYYSIAENGQKALHTFEKDWASISVSVNHILGKE